MSIEHQDLYASHARRLAPGAASATGQQAPTDSELEELRSLEPGIEFRVVDDIELTQGRQSRVSVLEYTKEGEDYRLIWKRMGAGKGLEVDEAEALQVRLLPYRESLISAGWNIPKLYFSEVVKIDGEAQIYSYEEFIPGGDGEQMVADASEPNFRKWHLTEEVISTLINYPPDVVVRREVCGRELTCLPHGLDLKHANVVLQQGTNKLFFVDLFGPKEVVEDFAWRTFESKLDSLAPERLLAVCATREGALLRFWRLARRKWAADKSRRPFLSEQFVERLDSLGLPKIELDFVASEIHGSCAWLDGIYSEVEI